MCVILVIDDGKFPKKQMLKDAEMMNPDGGAIAWLENGKIFYKKGIKAKTIHKLIKQKLTPKGIKEAIIHFRITSVGETTKELCHPFPICYDVPLDLSVENSDIPVLFHNGTIEEWESMLIKAMQKTGIPILQGDLSDSRVMAQLFMLYGDKILNTFTDFNKFAILSKDGIKKYGAWVNVKKISCSNDHFEDTFTYESGYNEGFSIYDYHRTDDSLLLDNDDEDQIINSYSEVSSYILTQDDKIIYDELTSFHGITDGELLSYLDDGWSLEEIRTYVESWKMGNSTELHDQIQSLQKEIEYEKKNLANIV